MDKIRMRKDCINTGMSLVSRLLVVLMIPVLAGCIYFIESDGLDPGAAEYYRTDYNNVWKAAVDALDEIGFVIVQADKNGGYISTDRMEKDGDRAKVSLRFFVKDDLVMVKSSSSSERLYVSKADGSSTWLDSPPHGRVMQNEIKREMAKRLQAYWISAPKNERVLDR